jgi:hypothetical protein
VRPSGQSPSAQACERVRIPKSAGVTGSPSPPSYPQRPHGSTNGNHAAAAATPARRDPHHGHFHAPATIPPDAPACGISVGRADRSRAPGPSSCVRYRVAARVEPKPDGPGGDMLSPAVGHALAFFNSLEQGEIRPGATSASPRADAAALASGAGPTNTCTARAEDGAARSPRGGEYPEGLGGEPNVSPAIREIHRRKARRRTGCGCAGRASGSAGCGWRRVGVWSAMARVRRPGAR